MANMKLSAEELNLSPNYLEEVPEGHMPDSLKKAHRRHINYNRNPAVPLSSQKYVNKYGLHKGMRLYQRMEAEFEAR